MTATTAAGTPAPGGETPASGGRAAPGVPRPGGAGSGRVGTWRLLRAFRLEQDDPDRFYRMLAADTVALVDTFAPVAGALVVDVGSGPGDLAEAFRARGSRAVAVDVDWDEMHCRQRDLEQAAVGDGTCLPFADATFDVACSSNVLEHVPDPLAMVADMVRVTRPGGLVFANYTLWLSLHGGHETAPWHFLGGAAALRRYERRWGQLPKNRFGTSLFPLGGRRFLARVRALPGVTVVDAFPRYFPRWTRRLVTLPGVGDVLTWNLAIVLRCTGAGAATGTATLDGGRSTTTSMRGGSTLPGAVGPWARQGVLPGTELGARIG